MISDVEVEDYQAIHRASVKLGRFTVVTGPTGSGKSALLRAMELVAFNARGTSYIRHGAKTCQAAIGFQDEGLVVGISRGGRNSDLYRVVRPGEEYQEPPQVDTYTKLAGAVPPEVSARLELLPINFAGQFDSPYLLTESGSQVARILGELTNVTLVFDAAREASRRKLETGRELRSAVDRLADLKEQAKGFRGLKDRLAAVADAEDRLVSLDFITEMKGRLELRWYQWRSATDDLAAAQQHAWAVVPPSDARLLELAGQRARLLKLAGAHNAAREDLEGARDAARNWQTAEIEAEEALHAALVGAGTCPTCGQSVAELCPVRP